MSLVVSDKAEGAFLKDTITQVTIGHEVRLCSHDEAFDVSNSRIFQLIWLQMSVPATQEVLSLTTSVRYASKANKSTVIIGIADNPLDVDLRLHGIDEVVLEPVTKAVVRQKYLKWTSVALSAEDHEPPPSIERSSTPGSSVSTESIHTDMSQSTTSSESSKPSSGHATPDISQLTPLRNFDTQNLSYQSRMLRQAMQSDHTTKEKLRRERIKDSCDQLRVLLPYIRGRKTDMASILEMTVDYLKIVNAALPTDFQNQITNFMSKTTRESSRGKSESVGRGGRRRRGGGATPSESSSAGKVTSTMETSSSGSDLGRLSSPSSGMYEMVNHNSRVTNSPRTSTPQVTVGIKRDSSDFSDVKTKRLLVQTTMTGSPVGTGNQSSLLYLHSDMDNRKDSIDLGSCREDTVVATHVQSLHVPQTHMYSDLEPSPSRLYSSGLLPADNYSLSPHAQMNTPSTARMSGLERDSGYGMYMDNSYYHYYGTQQQPTAGNGYGTAALNDHVNPNAVLPVTYATRIPVSSNRKYDDQDMATS